MLRLQATSTDLFDSRALVYAASTGIEREVTLSSLGIALDE